MRAHWLSAHDFTTKRGGVFLGDYARIADLFGHIGEHTVSVQVTSVVRASDRSFQVKWVETAYEHGVRAGTPHWTAILTVLLALPSTANTQNDTIVWVPDDRTVFTGDLLFNEGHPIMWAGPVENWIRACQYVLNLDPAVVVPGHGPITERTAVANMKAYFEYVRDEARRRFDAGLDFEEAARDINMTEYRGWSDPERIVANVFSLYKQWGAPFTPEQQRGLFGAMGRYHKELAAHDEACGHDH